VINRFVKRTSSGGVCINDVVWQNGWEGLPFGGILRLIPPPSLTVNR